MSTFSEEQRALNKRASESNLWSDGGYNTTLSDETDPKRIWRISKGTDEQKRKNHLDDWIEEAELSKLMGSVNVGPLVHKLFSKGSWLTDHEYRVAMLMTRFSEDLHSALFKKWDDEKNAPWKEYYGNDTEFGSLAGVMLVQRMLEMGQLCLLHTDMKPENVLVLIVNKNLVKLRMIDFDPQFMFYGCSCMGKVIATLGTRVGKWEQEIKTSFFSLLNIILMWSWFNSYVKTSKKSCEAAQACLESLKNALRTSHFPLDAIHAADLPKGMLQRLNHWQKQYRDNMQPELKNVSVIEEAYAEFPNLRDKHYDAEKGPLVSDKTGKYIPWKACADPLGCRHMILSTRQHLDLITTKTTMTCSQHSLPTHSKKAEEQDKTTHVTRDIEQIHEIRFSLDDIIVTPNFQPQQLHLKFHITPSGMQTLANESKLHNVKDHVLKYLLLTIRAGAATIRELLAAFRNHYHTLDASQLQDYIYLMKNLGNLLHFAVESKLLFAMHYNH